jgi:hypothetical protein
MRRAMEPDRIPARTRARQSPAVPSTPSIVAPRVLPSKDIEGLDSAWIEIRTSSWPSATIAAWLISKGTGPRSRLIDRLQLMPATTTRIPPRASAVLVRTKRAENHDYILSRGKIFLIYRAGFETFCAKPMWHPLTGVRDFQGSNACGHRGCKRGRSAADSGGIDISFCDDPSIECRVGRPDRISSG